MEVERGTVVKLFYKKGYGFINRPDGSNLFFHASATCDGVFENLREGMEVEYAVIEGPRKIRAIGVVAL